MQPDDGDDEEFNPRRIRAFGEKPTIIDRNYCESLARDKNNEFYARRLLSAAAYDKLTIMVSHRRGKMRKNAN